MVNNPFRYSPHPLVRAAADEMLRKIPEDSYLHGCLSGGKMMGVLLVSCPEGEELPELHRVPDFPEGTAYLAAFSGNLGQTAFYPGFVPPIYDLTDPEGGFRKGETEISAINKEVRSLEASPEYLALLEERTALSNEMDQMLEQMRSAMSVSRTQREDLRRRMPETGASADPVAQKAFLEGLTRQSQFEKAEFRRTKKDYLLRLEDLDRRIGERQERIAELKGKRAGMSDALQRWIFEQFRISNLHHEYRTVWDIFQDRGLVAPGGTGECAAPKLLQFAFDHGLQPLAMGEFWYGTSPQGSVRNHGDFYPSCSSKCGVLLPYMMQYLDIEESFPKYASSLRIIYEDESLLAIDKPGGMPSVPGLDGRKSALEILQETYPALEAVHRLDMDTMGVLVFAKNPAAALAMRRQFEDRGVSKTYRALLSPWTASPEAEGAMLEKGSCGRIELPLAPDYEDRPRQKVDFVQGKQARTDYEVKEVYPDGIVAVEFHPVDGRTHQLRVHAAHHAGLGRPILGDPLYGGAVPTRFLNPAYPVAGLQLLASAVSFRHPDNGGRITIDITEE